MSTHLVHLENGSNCLDQNRAANRSSLHADKVLGDVVHVVPQPGLKVRFQLGDVKVGPAAPGDELLGVVEEVEAKVEKGTGDGRPVDVEVLLVQVPASGATDQGGKRAVGAELVVLFANLEVDLVPDGIVQIDLAVDDVVPRWRRGVCDDQSAKPLSYRSAMPVIFDQGGGYK